MIFRMYHANIIIRGGPGTSQRWPQRSENAVRSSLLLIDLLLSRCSARELAGGAALPGLPLQHERGKALDVGAGDLVAVRGHVRHGVHLGATTAHHLSLLAHRHEALL